MYLERNGRAVLALGLALAMLVGGFLFLAVPAKAAVTAGATTPLVNAGQLVRDGSTAVPIFGITATSTVAADQLLSITVNFTGIGFNPGNNGDLLALNTNPALSGVALYEDVGSAPRALDATDVGVTANSAAWTANSVTLTFSEPFPAVAVGAYDWILVIRTSNNAASLAGGDHILATIPAGGIVFSGAVTQPTLAASANALTVSLTTVNDLLGPQTWIGPIGDAVNARAALSLRIVDGGIPANAGINDRLSEVIVQVIDVSATYGGTTLLGPNVNPAQSGIGLYRDSDGNGVWDATDTGVTLASISVNCVGALNVEDWCLFPNAEPVPDAAGPGSLYFVVVRSNAIATGDILQFAVLPGQIFASGIHPDDVNRPTLLAAATSSNLLGDDTPPCVTSGCGQPFDVHWANPTSSVYLYPVDRVLYFGQGMGPTSVPGQVVLSASDAGSGLFRAVYSNEPSLAGSPAPVALRGSGVDVTVLANYSFNGTSTAASSPAFVTVYDAVGNHATAPALFYVLDPSNPLIVPAPGWTNLPGPSFYVNGTGTLWFSPWISGTQTVDLTVDLSDTISGLRSATASSEPSLAGGPFYAQPTNLGGAMAYPGWTVTYAFNAQSTGASSPVTITACDNVANCATRNFAYALDATPPVVTLVAPSGGSVLSGSVVVAATATDAGSGVAGPLQAEVLGASGFMDMLWNGTAWVLPLSTALYPDGAQRIVVRAFDHVGNEGVAVVDVWFDNRVVRAPPSVAFVAPGAGALVSGMLTVQVSVTDPMGVASVTLVVNGTAYPMVPTGARIFMVALLTTGIPTGPTTLRVTAVDSVGLSTTVSLSVTVDNTPPVIVLVSPSSDHGAITLSATVTDAPSGVAGVSFVVDGRTYAAVADGQNTYSVTIWTTSADNGAHSYMVVAKDRAGNTATSAGTFSVNTPMDVYGAILAFAPLGTFLVLLVGLILALVLLSRRRRNEPEKREVNPEPNKPGEEL